MRRALPFAILGACLVVGVLPALAADQSVAIHDFRYAPASVAVKPGESVTWRADGYYMHSVHFDAEATGIGTAEREVHGRAHVPRRGDVRLPLRRPRLDARGRLRQPERHGPRPAAPPTPTPTGTAGGPTPTPSSTPGGGGSAAPLASFRAKASVRNRKVFLTLTVGGDKALRVRGTLKRGSKRVRRVSLLARPGRHKLRLPGKALEPGRYTLTLTAGDLRRVVHFRVRRS